MFCLSLAFVCGCVCVCEEKLVITIGVLWIELPVRSVANT
jgi:hypothetical protein